MAIGAERGNAIALPHSRIAQQSREAMRPVSKFAIGKTEIAVNDGCPLGKYFRGAIQEVRRVQWSCAVQRHLPAPVKSRFKLPLTHTSHMDLTLLVAQASACGVWYLQALKF